MPFPETNKTTMIHVYLDAGHGGLHPDTGEYVTPGKRSPAWEQGVLYEGVFNRDVCERLGKLLDTNGISWTAVHHAWRDTPLSDRVVVANAHNDPSTLPVYVSVHANAGGGTGLEVFTFSGQSASDRLASYLIKEWELQLPHIRVRKDYSDGDADKEALFYVLKHTTCPAILSENGFMDHPEDYKRLHSSHYRQDIAMCHVFALMKFINDLPNQAS